MIYGLVFSILVLIMEMVLFIMRSVQIESTLEIIPTKEKESLAKFQSGALLTPCDDPSIVSTSKQLSLNDIPPPLALTKEEN
jgi:hypothetical protein